MNFKEIHFMDKELIECELSKYLYCNDPFRKTIYDSMRYSVEAGGKRLRPVLLLEVFKMFKEDYNIALPFACALEMIHTYSLIHDDLPGMDNDDYRRGKLTNHKVFGEGIAILAGDGLLNLAFEIMLKYSIEKNEIHYYKAAYEIIKASGVNGMISGQAIDLESEGKRVDEETLNFIHLNKTSALIEAAVKAGAILGECSQEEYDALCKYARCIGLSFQIVDDILDEIGDENKLGKKTGSDKKNSKATYPSLYGLEESKKIVNELLNESIEHLVIFDHRADFLRELSRYLEIRES